MSEKTQAILISIRKAFSHCGKPLRSAGSGIVVLGLIGAAGYAIYTHPPMQQIPSGEIGIRFNQITGSATEFSDGAVMVIPGLYSLRRFPLRDQIYRPKDSEFADGNAPFQSIEGLSIGVDVSLRYALDRAKLVEMARSMPDNIGQQIIEPTVQGVLYKTFARYTVREIFSVKRQEIRESIENELKPLLARDGIKLQGVIIGKIDLPEDYKAGMEKLLAEELASEKMRYTLQLKEKQVVQRSLEADAEKVAREKAAEASAQEQIIAAKAQAEAMQHILPFKQKQIEQRKLEAEAEKVARIKDAEGNSQARQIEAEGEAQSRRKLADAEVYRQEKIGKVASEQMARDGELITRHPLLIQKAMADKLSDKISVIIAPPGHDGFIGSSLIGPINANHTESAEQTEGE